MFNSSKDIKGVIYDQSLFYIPVIIKIELNSYFGIETQELVARKS